MTSVRAMVLWMSAAVLVAGFSLAAAQETDWMTASQPTGAPAAALAARHSLFGSDKALWLMRLDEDGERYDLLVTPVSRQWRWVERDRSDPPGLVVAVSDRLHVLSPSADRHVIVPADAHTPPIPEDAPNHKYWPREAHMLAGCGAFDFNDDGWSVVVLVARGPVRAASRPVPAAKAAEGVFSFSRGAWSYVTDVPAEFSGRPGRTLAAAGEGRLYLLRDGLGRNSIAVLEKEAWTIAPAQRALAGLKPLALATLRGQTVLVALQRPQSGRRGPIKLVPISPDGTAGPPQTLQRDGKVLDWSLDDPPLVTALGPRLVVVARSAEADQPLELVLADAAGKAWPPETIEELSKDAPDRGGEAVYQYYMYAVTGLACLMLMLSFGRARSMTEITLPAGIRPASLVKRFGSLAIDYVPFLLPPTLVSLPQVIRPDGTTLPFSEVMSVSMQDTTTAWVYAASMALFLAYCTVAEYYFGTTLGKAVFGLRVIPLIDPRLTLRTVAARNVFKLFTVTQVPPLALVMFLTRFRQRLGDIVGRTIVAEVDPNAVGPTPPSAQGDPGPPGPDDPQGPDDAPRP